MAQKVHVGIVLDRSGSMEDCRADAIGAVNSYLRQVKDDKELEAKVSLIIFDSQGIDVIRDRVPSTGCAELAPSEYQPRAQTPLLDAVGHGAALLDKHKEPGERSILAIMTDGLENASREYTKDTIKALLDRKQKEDGWLVLYLGAGHDAWQQARAWACMPATWRPSPSSTSSEHGARWQPAHGAMPSRRDAGAEAATGGFTDDERAEHEGRREAEATTRLQQRTACGPANGPACSCCSAQSIAPDSKLSEAIHRNLSTALVIAGAAYRILAVTLLRVA